jgi:putative oxidoreductase
MKYVTWVAMGIVSLIMVVGGAAKLTGQPMATESFVTLGLPAVFGTFIGVCEVAGGIGIWFRKTSKLAAIGVALIMLGAIYYHVAHTPLVEGVAALVVLICCGWIISRKQPGLIGSA